MEKNQIQPQLIYTKDPQVSWSQFEQTGSIDAYLEFTQKKTSVKKSPERDKVELPR